MVLSSRLENGFRNIKILGLVQDNQVTFNFGQILYAVTRSVYVHLLRARTTARPIAQGWIKVLAYGGQNLNVVVSVPGPTTRGLFRRQNI